MVFGNISAFITNWFLDSYVKIMLQWGAFPTNWNWMICDDIWVWDGVGENVEAKRTQTLVICIVDPPKRQSNHIFIYFSYTLIGFSYIFWGLLGFSNLTMEHHHFSWENPLFLWWFSKLFIFLWGRLPSIHPLRKVIRILVSSGGPALLGDPFSRTEWIFAKR